MTKSTEKNKSKHKFSLEENALLTAFYPSSRAGTVAKLFNLRKEQVYRQAKILGLSKSQWFKDSPMASRLRQGDDIGRPYQFPKGHIPANKGKKGYCHPASVATQFKPGQKSQAWRPLGSERITKDGYMRVKITDTGYLPRDWKGKHILIWERLHGKPVPRGYIVSMRDKNKLNFKYENLELLSQSENMKRNSIHSYGKDIAKVYQLKGAIKRQINKQKRALNEQPNK